MSHSWVRKLFRKAFDSSPRRVSAAARLNRTRLQLETLESRLTPSGTPPTALPIPRQVVNENSAAVVLDLSTYFNDADLDPLSYSVVQTNSSGLIAPNVNGSLLTLNFTPNQYGYSYVRVTASDGSNTTTQAFEVLVRNTDNLVNDSAAAIKSATATINVLGNDGAGDIIRQVEAANINVVQNDTGNAVTSVTVTKSSGTPDFNIRAGSNRADYNVQIGPNTGGDLEGQMFSTVNQNGRDNGEPATANNAAGTNYMSSAIESNAAGDHFIPTFNVGWGSEYNTNVATAWFPHAYGWLAGWGVNSGLSNGAVNNTWRTVTANSGFTIGTATTDTFQDQAAGQSRIAIPGVSSQTDGLLLAIGGKNEDNYAMTVPNADGSWQIINRDNQSNGTNPAAGNERDPVAFVYVPKDMPNIVSGRIMGDGSVQLSSGNFTLTKTDVGTYQLSIPGQSAVTGVLMLSPEGGQATTADNFTTYEAVGNNFVIKTWDITGETSVPVAEDVGGANVRVASFAFIPFLNQPALRTNSVQSSANVANTSDLGATLSINPDGKVLYDPSTSAAAQALIAGESVVDTFTYTTQNLNGQTFTATVSVTVAFGLSNNVDLVNGVLTINSTPGVASTLGVNFDGTNYTFTDNVPFYLSPAAQAAFSGTATTSIAGLSSAVNQIVINTSDGVDVITLNGLNDSFTINGGGDAGDTVNIANTLTFTGDATIAGVGTITAAAGAKIVTPTGTVTLSASDALGTSTDPILTQAASLALSAGAGGIFVTEDDGATATATTTDGAITIVNGSGTLNATANAGAGNISITSLAGTLNIAGTTTTTTGSISLSSGDAITLGASINAGSGTIAIAANTDAAGSESYDQGVWSLTTTNTTVDALRITVGGAGDAILGVGQIGSAAGGVANVSVADGDILWSPLYTLPDIATSNTQTLRANSYVFATTGPASSIGSLAAPIQSDVWADFGTASMQAGTGGIFWTDWGATDLVVTNAVAQGTGDIQLIAANAGGSNLAVLNVTTGSGNITMIADDDLFLGNLNNAPETLPGFIGGDTFSGTVSLLANRDGGNEQRILMRPGSIIKTSNTTANAVLMRTWASDNSPTDASIGGVTLTNVTVGDGGTITIDTNALPSATGNIIQQDIADLALDAGPNGTVILKAANILNAAAPANLAAIGDAVPLRIRAGNMQVTSINAPIRIVATIPSTITATVAAVGAPIVNGALINLSTETGILTIGGDTNTDGGPIDISGVDGVIVNGALGDANTGNITVSAGANNVVFNSSLSVRAGQAVTLTDGDFAELGPTTSVIGTLTAANGVVVGSGETLNGTGLISGPVRVTTGGMIAPGTSAGVLTTGALTLGGAYAVDINGTTPGTQYDQIDVAGAAVDLTGSTLNVLLGYLPTLPGDTFTIIKNYGSLTGTFSNVFPLQVGAAVFNVNYAGGPSNNDVVLTMTNVRPGATFAPIVPNPRSIVVAQEPITFSEPVTGFDVSDLTLTLDGNNVPLTGVTITGSGASYTIEGLEALTNVNGTYVLTLTATGSGIQDLDSPAGTIYADAVVSWVKSNNVAPVLDNSGEMKVSDILQEDVNNAGTSVANLIVSAGSGRITDVDGDPLGIAVSAVDNANGTWQYSTNGSSSWTPFGVVSETSARLLAADASTRVRFVPNAGFFGKVPVGLTFRAWDQTTGSNGGTADITSNGSSTSFSAAVETASMFVMYVPKAQTVSFTQDVNGYTGAQDTMLAEVAPFDTERGTTDPVGGLLVDYNTAGEMGQVLLRFDSIFGNGPGQIPLGSTIVSAVLTLSTNNTGAVGAFHRMRTTWDQAVDTWTTFGDGQNGHNQTPGVQTDGVEAAPTYFSFGGPPGVDQNSGTGLTQFGVLPDLQAWSNGEANHGWAIMPWVGGTDGWAFHSSEAVDLTDRPTLSVKFLPPGASVSTATMRQGFNGYNGTVDTELRQNQPDADRSTVGELFVDYDDGNLNQTEALIRFNNLVGYTPTSVPAGANVVASTLILPSTGNSSPGQGGTFNRMLVDWGNADTWNTFGSGLNGRNNTPGIQADGTDAAATWNFQAGNPFFTPLAQATIFPFDATADVQAWVNGTPNYGWGGLPWFGGDNGWSFNTSDQANPLLRPQLVTYYVQAEHEHSQLDISDGELTFVAGGGASGLGIGNNLAVSVSNGTYAFSDPNDVIILTPGAIAAGWTGSGTNTVTGPSSSVSFLAINTGLGTDTITINGADDPLSINGGNSGADVLNLAGDIAGAGGTVNFYGVQTINRTGGVVAADTMYITAPTIGSSVAPIRTAVGSLYVLTSGGAFINDADDVTIASAVATGAASLSIGSTAGDVIVGGPLTTEAGNVTLTAGGDVVLSGATVNGTLTATAAGNVTWGGLVDINSANNPDGGNAPAAVLVAQDYNLSSTSPTGSVGSVLAPIQTDALSGTSVATLAAGSGGVFLTDWGAADMTVASATATGGGDIQLIAGNVAGSNITVGNAFTQSGNIFLAADDTLTITGAIGGAGFSGTVTVLANRDDGLEQRINMAAGSSIKTENTTANAILLSGFATDTSPVNETIGGITLAQVSLLGSGGTITIKGANDATYQGNIVQLDNTTTIDAGPTGTVVLSAVGLQNVADPAAGAQIGSAATPIRVRAGNVQINSVNSPVNVTFVESATVTASVTAAGTNAILPGATLSLSTEAGSLTIANPLATPGGAITLTGAGGVVLNAAVGNSTDGPIAIAGNLSGNGAINAGSGAVTITQAGNSTYAGVISGAAAVAKAGTGSLTLTAANLYTGGTTVSEGTLIVNNTTGSGTGTGDVAVSGGTLGGTGSISGNVVVSSGAVAPGASAGAGVLSVGGNVDVNSAAQFNVELDGPAAFDQLAVSGNVNLNSNGNAAGGATLNLTAANAAVLSGTSYTIVTGASVSGTFRNFDGNELTDGESFVSAGGVRFTIDYTPTSVSLTVAAPTVTGVVPFSGPTSGGQTVIISGTNLGGVSGVGGVKFGGTNATSYTVLSNSSIQAVTPARAAGIVDVIVTNNGQASANTAADNYEYIQGAAAPQFGSFTVNGGDMYAINAYGFKVAGLAGNNSIIEQLYVTFDIGVTLGAGAFTLDAGPVTANIPGGVNPVAAGTNVVTIIAEADPTTLDTNGGHKGYRLRFSGSAAYLNTFDNSPTGNGGTGNIFTTLKDGFYKLNIVGANVHAGSTVAGTPMASNVTQSFWTMFASYAPDDRSISAMPGDGNSIISVNSSVIDFAVTNGDGYGAGNLADYNANFDWNLDGDVGDDLIEFAKRFGAEWAF